MKNKLNYLFLVFVIFINIVNTKAVTYNNSKKSNCDNIKYYYIETSSEADDSSAPIGHGWVIREENTSDFTECKNSPVCVKNCLDSNGKLKNGYCVAVSETCNYSIDYTSDYGTTHTLQAFCLEGYVKFENGISYVEDTTDPLNEVLSSTIDGSKITGVACGMIKSYLNNSANLDSLFVDGSLDFSKISDSIIKDTQKNLWSHKANSTENTCSAIENFLDKDKKGYYYFFSKDNKLTFNYSSNTYESTAIIKYQNLATFPSLTSNHSDLIKLYLKDDNDTFNEVSWDYFKDSNSSLQHINDIRSILKNGIKIVIDASKINLGDTYNVSSSASIKIGNRTDFESSFKVLKPVSGSYQKIGIPKLKKTTTDIKEDTNTQTSFSLNLGNIKIIKKDKKTDQVLAGAKFKLEYKYNGEYVPAKYYNGKYIGEVVTDSNGVINLTNLPYGDYKIVETSVPEGFELATDLILERSLNDNNKNIEEVIYNEPKNIIFSKKDITNSEELAGAKISIYKYNLDTKEKEELLFSFTSGDKPFYNYLSPGTYVLVEEIAPNGFSKVQTEFVFNITKNYKAELLDVESSENIKTEDNKIILYNDVVKVPDTKINKVLIYGIISSVLIISGSALIYFKQKKLLKID